MTLKQISYNAFLNLAKVISFCLFCFPYPLNAQNVPKFNFARDQAKVFL